MNEKSTHVAIFVFIVLVFIALAAMVNAVRITNKRLDQTNRMLAAIDPIDHAVIDPHKFGAVCDGESNDTFALQLTMWVASKLGYAMLMPNGCLVSNFQAPDRDNLCGKGNILILGECYEPVHKKNTLPKNSIGERCEGDGMEKCFHGHADDFPNTPENKIIGHPVRPGTGCLQCAQDGIHCNEMEENCVYLGPQPDNLKKQ